MNTCLLFDDVILSYIVPYKLTLNEHRFQHGFLKILMKSLCCNINTFQSSAMAKYSIVIKNEKVCLIIRTILLYYSPQVKNNYYVLGTDLCLAG